MAVKSEKRTEQDIVLAASKNNCVLFKNNVGTAYRGTLMSLRGENVLTKLQFIRYGLGGIKGGSDQIGLTRITITEDMVGKDIAVFTAIEVKKNKKGSYKATEEQKNFIEFVKREGGFAGVCDCEQDLFNIIKTPHQ